VAWSSVAAAAAAKGLANATRPDLLEALFADGVSTAEVVTELSGRGVGMSAVRDACRALGGVVEVESQAGRGTTVRCGFPDHIMGGNALIVAQERPLTQSLAPAV
jgi:two-component system chemotaxis sensor kinase CheA